MPTVTDSVAAVGALQGLLQEAFSSDYADALADAQPAYNGIDVLLLDDERLDPARAGSPYILLTVVEDTDNDEWGFNYRRATIEAVCSANDFNGGMASEGDTPIQALMSRYLQQFIETGYNTLNAAGLQGISINGPAQAAATIEEVPAYRCTHRIQFHYRTS